MPLFPPPADPQPISQLFQPDPRMRMPQLLPPDLQARNRLIQEALRSNLYMGIPIGADGRLPAPSPIRFEDPDPVAPIEPSAVSPFQPAFGTGQSKNPVARQESRPGPDSYAPPPTLMGRLAAPFAQPQEELVREARNAVAGMANPLGGPTALGMVQGLRAARMTPRGERSFERFLSAKAKGKLNDEQIRKVTGWDIGKDGVPRYEMSDKGYKFKGAPDPNGGEKLDFLENLIDHPTIFRDYPELRDVLVTFKQADKVKGKFSLKSDGQYRISIEGPDKGAIESGLLHEIQHAVQDLEGFAPGGMKYPSPEYGTSMKDFYTKLAADKTKKNWDALADTYNDLEKTLYDRYRGFLGELEANTTQASQSLSLKDRRKMSAWARAQAMNPDLNLKAPQDWITNPTGYTVPPLREKRPFGTMRPPGFGTGTP